MNAGFSNPYSNLLGGGGGGGGNGTAATRTFTTDGTTTEFTVNHGLGTRRYNYNISYNQAPYQSVVCPPTNPSINEATFDISGLEYVTPGIEYTVTFIKIN